jgi:hypothetical protein
MESKKFIDVDLIADFQELAILIRKAAFSVGVSQKIDDMEVNFIAQFMQDEFAHLTLERFDDAFKKCAAGKFEAKIEAYNNFSLALVGKVMRAYREFRAKEQLKAQNVPQLPESTPKTQDQKGELHWEYFQEFIQKGEMPTVGQWATALNWGVKNGKIFISKEELIYYKESVKEELYKEAKELQRVDRSEYNVIMNVLQDPKELRRECQNRYMKQWVKDQL